VTTPDAREDEAGRGGETKRHVIPLKPGNAGGEKGPLFKANATRGREKAQLKATLRFLLHSNNLLSLERASKRPHPLPDQINGSLDFHFTDLFT